MKERDDKEKGELLKGGRAERKRCEPICRGFNRPDPQ